MKRMTIYEQMEQDGLKIISKFQNSLWRVEYNNNLYVIGKCDGKCDNKTRFYAKKIIGEDDCKQLCTRADYEKMIKKVKYS